MTNPMLPTGGGTTTATPTLPPIPSSPPPLVPADPLPAPTGTTASPDASKPTTVSTPIADGPAAPSVTPGAPIDGVQAPTGIAATGLGRMDLPRTPGLGTSSSMADLVAANALPGVQGVVITDPVSDPSELFSDMYKLTEQTGAEYALTRENGQLVLRSGAPNSVRVPTNAVPVAHTHPGGTEPLPSIQDIQVLNNMWRDNPGMERPNSTIIWGSGSSDVTPYNATGLDQLKPLK